MCYGQSVSVGASPNLGKIPEAFENYFRNPRVSFPAAVQASGGSIREGGWDIRYMVGREGARAFMELYAVNRRTNDRHIRIYDDGVVEPLQAVSDGFSYDPKLPGDRERAQREQRQKDEPLIADLRKKGLWGSGDRPRSSG